MKKLLLLFQLITLLGFSSCGFTGLFLKEKNIYLKSYRDYSSQDYIQHLGFLGERYLKTPNIKIYKLSGRSKKYLSKIYKKIIENNELIFKQKERPKIYIIRDEVPFYFSLPGANFFFSLGLIKSYMKNEGVLIACFAFEILKSLRNIYPKKILYPKGFTSTGEMLALTRLPFGIKVNLHKWTFNILKRSNYDPYSHLMWMQIQNKNPLDFSFQHGHNNKMIREEYFLKNYILKEVGPLEKKQLVEKNSSREFYNFLESLKKS